MVDYNALGFDSFEDYYDTFLATLKETNKKHDYFVDWEKVQQKAEKYENEISLMNVLAKTDEEEREEKLREILADYPDTIQVVPLILAIRDDNVDVLDEEKLEPIHVDFDPSKTDLDKTVEFCKKSGVLDLFSRIDDLYDYIFGVEVGLDTNARKNRSGKSFESIVESVLDRELSDISGVTYTSQSILKLKRRKYADFVILKDDEPAIGIEVNFYNTTGSKPSEVARSYIKLEQRLVEEEGKVDALIWITDGPAWRKMEEPITSAMRSMDYVLNLEMAESKIRDLIKAVT